MNANNKTLISVVGPTAIGKTSLCIFKPLFLSQFQCMSHQNIG